MEMPNSKEMKDIKVEAPADVPQDIIQKVKEDPKVQDAMRKIEGQNL